MKILIVDDEPLARRRIRTLLGDEEGIANIIECGNGTDAVQLIRTERPDVVFLDVQMPELDGFGVVREIGSAEMPPVIFVTAYDDYAIRAFEVQALDYLLKPVDRERFKDAFARVRTAEETKSVPTRLAAMLDRVRSSSGTGGGRIGVRTGGRIVFLRLADIDWLEADGNHVRFHVGREVHVSRETLSNLEARLPQDEFMRVHRSATVNLARVKEIQPWFQGDYVLLLADGTRINTGRSYRARLRTLIENSV